MTDDTTPKEFLPHFLTYGAGPARWEMPEQRESDIFVLYYMAEGLPFPVATITSPTKGFWPSQTVRLFDTCQMTGAARLLDEQVFPPENDSMYVRRETERLYAERQSTAVQA